jgi:hypothetical protein
MGVRKAGRQGSSGQVSHALDDWSLGPAQEAETKAERLLSWEPTEWAPTQGSS